MTIKLQGEIGGVVGAQEQDLADRVAEQIVEGNGAVGKTDGSDPASPRSMVSPVPKPTRKLPGDIVVST
jgi:hypothetical protein